MKENDKEIVRSVVVNAMRHKTTEECIQLFTNIILEYEEKIDKYKEALNKD